MLNITTSIHYEYEMNKSLKNEHFTPRDSREKKFEVGIFATKVQYQNWGKTSLCTGWLAYDSSTIEVLYSLWF